MFNKRDVKIMSLFEKKRTLIRKCYSFLKREKNKDGRFIGG